jgi:hypothetical protein
MKISSCLSDSCKDIRRSDPPTGLTIQNARLRLKGRTEYSAIDACFCNTYFSFVFYEAYHAGIEGRVVIFGKAVGITKSHEPWQSAQICFNPQMFRQEMSFWRVTVLEPSDFFANGRDQRRGSRHVQSAQR